MRMDDLTQLAPSAFALQLLINEVYTMTSNLDLSFIVEKSVCMNFCPRGRKQGSEPVFLLNGVKMKIVQDSKYSGMIVSEELCSAKDINRYE